MTNDAFSVVGHFLHVSSLQEFFAESFHFLSSITGVDMNRDRIFLLTEIATNNALMVFNRNLGFEEEACSYEGVVMGLVGHLADLDESLSEYHQYELLKAIGALELYRDAYMCANSSKGVSMALESVEREEEIDVVF